MWPYIDGSFSSKFILKEKLNSGCMALSNEQSTKYSLRLYIYTLVLIEETISSW